MSCSTRFPVLLLLAVTHGLAQDVVISQIYGGGGNAGATLRNDFVEIFNRGITTVDLTGWSVQYASATGTTWQLTRLSGSLASGRYFLIQQAAGTGGSVDLPAPDASGNIAMSATSAKVALVRGDTPLEGGAPANQAVLDLVGYGAADFFRTAPVRALTNTTAALRRGNGCIDTAYNASDFVVGPPAPRNSGAQPTDCAAQPQPPTPVSISRIQGNAETSPLAGQSVVTTGIVTARRGNGFFLQSRPEDDDNDPATSEGILVFFSTAPRAEPPPGTLVRVMGTVTEFRPASDPNSPSLTELTDPVVEFLSSGYPLPEPISITSEILAPAGGLHLLEHLEGMRVRVDSLRAVSPTGGSIDEGNARAATNGIFYAVLEGAARPHREPGVRLPDPAAAGTPRFDGNPERLRIDTAGAASVALHTRAINLTGPLDYSFRTYTVFAETFAGEGSLSATPLLASGPQEVSAASMNLRRFYDTIDDPGASDVVLTQEAFDRRLSKIALAVRDVLRSPALIAVQEVENLTTLQALAARLGPGYRAYLEPGNDPGGINIGFLADSSRLTAVSIMQLEKTATYRTPSGATATLHDRPPLLLRATAGNLSFTALNLHPRSLIGVETEDVRAKRLAQAQAIAALVQSSQAEPLIVLCDCNAFPFSDGYVDVTGIIAGTPPALRNLALTIPPDQGYTYIQDGSAQVLDQIVVNQAFLSRLTRFQVAHLNAGFPETLYGDASRPERFSDHDVPVAYFSLSPPALAPAGVTSAASFLSGAVTPGQIVTIFGTNLSDRVLVDGMQAPVLAALPNQVSAILPFSIAGNTRLRVEPAGEITLPVLSAAPALFAGPGGQAAALNQDGSYNLPSSPAEKGSIVVLYAAGLGGDGRDVSVTIGGFPAAVLYAGQAPGQVEGLFQINARVSGRAASGAQPVVLTVGTESSNAAVTVSIK
ncbi:MAG: lamin tail domain-containing protein [Acidobacteriia bacterium]|nr:lamin tail domain-containing protein [Terriglobia bacterium]